MALRPPPLVEKIAEIASKDDPAWFQSHQLAGKVTPTWQRWLTDLHQDVAEVLFTQTARADAPTTLGASDAGNIYYITDFFHWVRWNGSAYEFMDEGSGHFAVSAVAKGAGWALCDGSATTYLAVGATLTAVAFTTPNLSGSPAYFKSGAAYTGSLLAAVAPSLSGSTADATATISGTTGASAGGAEGAAGAAGGFLYPSTHGHGAGTLAVDNHQHAKGTLAVDAAGEPARLTCLPYFRR